MARAGAVEATSVALSRPFALQRVERYEVKRITAGDCFISLHSGKAWLSRTKRGCA